MRFWRSERGAGSILGLTVVMVIATALVAASALAAGHQARRQAAAAADLAALAGARSAQAEAGATGLPATDEPCRIAAVVAQRNHAELRDCVVDGVEVEVQVRVEVRSPWSWLPDQTRRARGGPSSPGGS